MAAFNKLIRGGAEALRRMQAELGAAAEKVPYPGAPGALQLYHGSPHAFDSFDFENNLRRGEGAMAYGPGGYMTGNRPLAEHYARTLDARHSGGQGLQLVSPWDARVGGRKIVGNLGALNSYFLDTAGGGLARDELGNLVSMGARPRSKYTLSMDANLDPWSGVVNSKPNGMRSSQEFLPGQQWSATSSLSKYDPFGTTGMVGPGRERNPHGTLSGMLAEDKDATLRYLQYKEALRAMDRNMVDANGRAVLPQTKASPGWKDYVDRALDLSGSSAGVPDTTRVGAQHPGAFLFSNSDWRLTPRNSDWAMKLGESLGKELDPHMDLRLQVDRARRTPGAPSNKAPWLYTADYGAGPNDMLLYDAPLREQSTRVRGALTDLLDNADSFSLRQLRDAWKGDPRPGYGDYGNLMGHTVVQALPQDLSGMGMMRDAGIPATAYLRAGPRTGGLGIKFDPGDFNFVIHDQSKLDNITRERLK